jgi:hypothetical protein
MGWHFIVTLSDETGDANYSVTMDKDFVTRIGAEFKPEKVVEKSFEFLLERQSKEKILAEFDITIITHYYPEFIGELEKKLIASQGFSEE